MEGHGGQAGGGCFGLTHPSETPRSMGAEKKPLDLAVTSHGAFAGVPPSVPQAQPPPPYHPEEVGLAAETAHSFLSSTHPQMLWFSACAVCLCTCHRVALQMCLSVTSLPCAGSLLSRRSRFSISVGDSD